MSKLENKSIEALKEMKEECLEKIEQHKYYLTLTTSLIYTLNNRMWLKFYTNRFNLIEAELKRRKELSLDCVIEPGN
jgi:hypothetical protein